MWGVWVVDRVREESYSPRMITFANSFSQLPSFLFERVTPTPIKDARLMHATALRERLTPGLSDDDFKRWINGEHSLPGEQRIATRYAGHQFGVWAGQLGDGRAISLGEILSSGERLEIQTKGSGLTPFSRMGDGRAVIRSSVREYLASEALHSLGVPTTRVLALLTGSDSVHRESVERSAVVARVFPTNLRFGHFELCYHFKREAELDALVQYTQETFYPGLTVAQMLTEIVRRTAHLMARWQDVGFCHGVMNTDNMSILGLTIDYGPCGFLEDTVLNYVCNHSDHQGRYAYNQQPSIGMWNLERLLVCFLKFVPKEFLQETLNLYPSLFEAEYLRLSRQKLGLLTTEAEDYKLFVEILQTLAKLSIDYTFFWRELCGFCPGDSAGLERIRETYGTREELEAWLLKYGQRLGRETSDDRARAERMRLHNPKYVLKNYIAQEVISDVEAGHSEKLVRWLKVLERPFDEHPEVEAYAGPTPPEHKHYEVSCSS